jgi:hypothetical protein
MFNNTKKTPLTDNPMAAYLVKLNKISEIKKASLLEML